jgi:rubrerythrin
MSTATFSLGSENTIKNLLTAYQGEMNAQAKYRNFASQADAEGLHGVGSLFRAAARAEQIHANAQARAIRHLGGTATAVIELTRVGHTLENLNNALDGENYEIAVVYPAFIEEASARINAMAARSFQWALEAERTHARLYGDAICLLERNRTDTWIGVSQEFSVCPVCACTSLEKQAENCIVCNYPADRAETIR